jgi:hypothetical protein
MQPIIKLNPQSIKPSITTLSLAWKQIDQIELNI